MTEFHDKICSIFVTGTIKRRKRNEEFTSIRCDGFGLTCNKSQIPQLQNDQPAWHPSGEYIVFQSQDPNLGNLPGHMTQGGAGVNNNLWIVTKNGDKFYQLTNVKKGEATLHAHFSHDGKKLFWAARAKEGGQGKWMLKVADFIVNSQGVRLDNEKSYRPLPYPKAFYESHGFSLDDSKLIFCASPTMIFDLDIYTFDLATHKLENLTNSPGEWDEHGILSASGRKIVWVSSKGTPYTPVRNWAKTLKTDYWLMNFDGSQKTQLTFLNQTGYPGHPEKKVIVADLAWNKAGDKIVALVSYGKEADILLIEFKQSQTSDDGGDGGECGVKALQKIGDGAFPKYSPDGNLIAYTRETKDRHDPDGMAFEIYIMNADGSGERCLTCNHPDLANTRWRGQPYWHPTEEFVVFTAESGEYPRQGRGSSAGSGAGRNHNVWVITADGNRAWPMTDYDENWGAIRPSFSQYS